MWFKTLLPTTRGALEELVTRSKVDIVELHELRDVNTTSDPLSSEHLRRQFPRLISSTRMTVPARSLLVVCLLGARNQPVCGFL